MRKPPHFNRSRPVPQPSVHLPSPEFLPNGGVHEEVSESEHMPFNQAILELDFQSEIEMPQENTGYDYQEPQEQHKPFIPWTGQDFMSEQNMPVPLKYERMTESDHMPFNPAFLESEYQTFGETSPENVGYQPPQQQHIPFIPYPDNTGQDYMSQPLGSEAGGNIA